MLALVGTSDVTGEKGTMSKTSVDCGLAEMLPAWTQTQAVKEPSRVRARTSEGGGGLD